MSETVKMLLMVLLTIGVLFLTLRVAAWQMKRACLRIIRDLKQQGAVDVASAVPLSYSKTSIFRIGMRDYRPKALEQLVKLDVVRFLEGGRYYLRESQVPDILVKLGADPAK